MNQASWIAVGSLLLMLTGLVLNEIRTRRRELNDVKGRLDTCEQVRSDLLGELNDDRIKHRGEIVRFESDMKHMTEQNRELRGLVMGETVPPAMAAVIQAAVNGINEIAGERTRLAVSEVLARLERIEGLVTKEGGKP